MIRDNNTPSIRMLQNDMTAFLPGKRKTRSFQYLYDRFSLDRS